MLTQPEGEGPSLGTREFDLYGNVTSAALGLLKECVCLWGSGAGQDHDRLVLALLMVMPDIQRMIGRLRPDSGDNLCPSPDRDSLSGCCHVREKSKRETT